MKSVLEKNRGYGCEVPPILSHIVPYFIEKGASTDNALDFFNHYQGKDWKNLKGQRIKNWKTHAWEWIWSKR